MLRTIKVSGSSKDIGYAIGITDADSINNTILNLPEFCILQSIWSGSSYLKSLDLVARKFFPEFVTELESMADGACVDYEALFIWNCRGDLPSINKTRVQLQGDTPDGCTTLLIPSIDKSISIIAHNEDGPEQIDGQCYWLSVEQNNGLSYSTFHYPGMLPGHTMSFNSYGLVQTINDIRSEDIKIGIPRNFVCRAILECENIDKALELLKSKDRASGFHHSLGHISSPNLVSVEAPASGHFIKDIIKPTAHANHLISEKFSNIQQAITKTSKFRQELADNLLEQSTKLDPKSILFYKSSEGPGIYRRPGDGDEYARFTLATGIFKINTNNIDLDVYINQNTNASISTKYTI